MMMKSCLTASLKKRMCTRSIFRASIPKLNNIVFFSYTVKQIIHPYTKGIQLTEKHLTPKHDSYQHVHFWMFVHPTLFCAEMECTQAVRSIPSVPLPWWRRKIRDVTGFNTLEKFSEWVFVLFYFRGWKQNFSYYDILSVRNYKPTPHRWCGAVF